MARGTERAPAVSTPAEARLERLLSRGELDGAFFLHGDAVRLVDQAARRLIDAALDPATREFNLDIFRGAEVEPDRLAGALAMLPAMADRRVVALFEAQELSPTGRGIVERVLSELPTGLTFVITARIPARSKAAFYRRLKDRCTTLEWSAPREAEIPGWLIERAKTRYGIRLTARAAEGLAAAVGADLDLLDSELQKLAGAANGRVDFDLVRDLVPNVRSIDRWVWLDRVASRDYRAALRELPALLAEPRESAVGLLAAMVDHHLCLGLALEGGSRLVGTALVQAGKPYLKWKAGAYARQAKRWTAAGLDSALRLMRRADLRAKTGGSDAGVLEELLLSLELLSREAA